MAYDEIFAERVRALIRDEAGYSERKMFGGICFMIDGNMACGVTGGNLMLRLSVELAQEVLAVPGVRPMDFTGRPMKSMVYVDSEGTEDEADLTKWVAIALEHVKELPAK
jgi:TfoX/Sxy family transcriptional regulator of competence genes